MDAIFLNFNTCLVSLNLDGSAHSSIALPQNAEHPGRGRQAQRHQQRHRVIARLSLSRLIRFHFHAI